MYELVHSIAMLFLALAILTAVGAGFELTRLILHHRVEGILPERLLLVPFASFDRTNFRASGRSIWRRYVALCVVAVGATVALGVALVARG